MLYVVLSYGSVDTCRHHCGRQWAIGARTAGRTCNAEQPGLAAKRADSLLGASMVRQAPRR